MKKIFILFAVSILIFSCVNKVKSDLQKPLVLRDGILYKDSTSTKPYTGRNKSKMMDMIIESEVINGIREGDFISYYPNKKIQMIGKMKENKNVGLWKYFYPDGKVQTIGYFFNDTPDSIWKWYNEKGFLIETGKFEIGKRIGEWNYFDSLGRLSLVRIFKDDKQIDSTKTN